jgi:glycosyltransferase involved in cell wall biosynthesis
VISVVIPTWQRHELLTERALPSVLSQDADLEVVVVSDGPETAAFARDLRAMDPRIRFFAIPRPRYPTEPLFRWHTQGVRAINRGIDAAAGDRLLIMGDDDELAEGALPALLGGPVADVVYGVSSVRQRDGEWLSWLPPLGEFYAFPCGAALIDLERLGEMRLEADTWRRTLPADRDFWQRLYAAGFTFDWIPQTVFRYWPSTAYAISA